MSDDFYKRLDERMAEERIERIFRNRPDDLHDYQGCKADEARSSEPAAPEAEPRQPCTHPSVIGHEYGAWCTYCGGQVGGSMLPEGVLTNGEIVSVNDTVTIAEPPAVPPAQEPKHFILTIFPEAYARDTGHGSWDIIDVRDKDKAMAIGYGRSESQAWDDAMSRQTKYVQPSPRPAGVRTEEEIVAQLRSYQAEGFLGDVNDPIYMEAMRLENMGFEAAHKLRPCGHSRGDYRDPNYGTLQYEGDEKCVACAQLAALQQSHAAEVAELKAELSLWRSEHDPCPFAIELAGLREDLEAKQVRLELQVSATRKIEADYAALRKSHKECVDLLRKYGPEHGMPEDIETALANAAKLEGK